MKTEFEATFTNVSKDEVRDKLNLASAKLVRPEFLQRRYVFHLPKEHEAGRDGWARVRDEGDKITMSVKVVSGNKIDDQKESCLEVNDFEEARHFLSAIGCKEKGYQESKREIWMLDDVEITLDEWPFLEPFVEIEGKSEEEVKIAAEKLGFDYNKAQFCAVGKLYRMKYGFSEDVINSKTPRMVFDMENPFV